jgi:cytochrome c oxidase subunit IV
MAGTEHKEPNYMGVFWALLILTLAEVGIFYLHLPRMAMVVSLIALALVKAGLVAAYFMHLRFENRTLALIVVSPLLLSAVIIIGLTPDARFGWPQKAPTLWELPGQEGAGSEGHEGITPEAQPGAQPAPSEQPKPAITPAQAEGPA